MQKRTFARTPLPHIVNARTTPKNATERLAMRNPPAIEQTKHPRPRMWSGARRFVAQAGSKPWLPQVSSPQTHSAPSASFPPHDLSRGHADLLCLLLLDRLLAACRAVDFLRLSLTSDRRVFLGGDPTYFPRACASGDLQKKPSPFTTDHKHLIQNHLWVKASPYFHFTFTFTHCHYEPSRYDPRRSMYEKRIKHKVATQAVKAKVKEKRG